MPLPKGKQYRKISSYTHVYISSFRIKVNLHVDIILHLKLPLYIIFTQYTLSARHCPKHGIEYFALVIQTRMKRLGEKRELMRLIQGGVAK